MFNELDISKYQQTMEELILAHGMAVDALTKEQFAKVLLQAIACGDFQRHVMHGVGQQVVYLPYQQQQELLAKIKELESELAGRKSNKCQSCLKNDAVSDYECPYDSEINGGAKTCNCCVECRQKCLMEI